MANVEDDSMVRLTVQGIVVYTRFANFLELNQISKTEEWKIKGKLEQGKAYHGGGGSLASWKIELDA
ncbi:MAG: hypothetical protein C5B59_17450 [Bacteroidetes bacterium]|nr:MAG: hypothetical protein C5B59_17450 [Bacteroidota bacterium]